MTLTRNAVAGAQIGKDKGLAAFLDLVGGLDEQMPGWRVGWMAGSQAVEKLRSFKQSMTICATSVSQWAAVEMMKR